MSEIYQERLKDRIKAIISDWTAGEPPDEAAVHRFFYGLKGTAGTLGINSIAEAADEFIGLYKKNGTKKLSEEEVQALIIQLRLLLIDPSHSVQTGFPLEEERTDQLYVLLIDQDMAFANFAKDSLERKGITVAVAPSGRKGLELFYSLRPNFVLIDIQLPDMNGLDLLRKISVRARNNFTPVAIMSANPREEDQIRTFALGATDFITKPVDSAVFVPYVMNRVVYKDEIQRLVITDELTGAYNRRHLSGILPEHMQAFKARKDSAAFVLMDLDHFKQVNDKYGHAIGDMVLRTFAQTVKNSVRERDLLFRQGGEEFALLLPSITKEKAKEIVSRIQKTFSEIRFPVNGETFTVTFSAGITATSEHNLQSDELVQEADQALYYAKEHGRNQVIIYDPLLMGPREGKLLEVILVDRDPLIRAILTKQLMSWESDRVTVRLQSYTDGEELLKSDWKYDDHLYLVLLDMAAPDHDALETLRTLRTELPPNRLFISVLTKQRREQDILSALQQGADDYMQKPSLDLLPRIGTFLKRIRS